MTNLCHIERNRHYCRHL